MKKIKLHYQILISMILAIIVSFLFTGSTIFIPLGDLFIRLLKMIIVPLIFSSIVVGIGSINKSVNMKLKIIINNYRNWFGYVKEEYKIPDNFSIFKEIIINGNKIATIYKRI